MDDTDKVNQSGCCEGGQCCPPGQVRDKGKSARWKTLAFTAVVLLACGVTAYSLFWRGDSAATTSCCPPGSPAAAACGQTAANPGFDHEAAPVGLCLTALLSGEESLSSEQLTAIGDLRAAAESRGEQLQFELLQPADSEYQKLVELNRVVSLPAFVIRGQEGILVLSGDQFGIDTVKKVFNAATLLPSANAASESSTR